TEDAGLPGGAGTDRYRYAGAAKAVTRVANSASGTTDSIVDPSGGRLGAKVGSTTNWFVPDLHGSLVASLDQADATIVNAQTRPRQRAARSRSPDAPGPSSSRSLRHRLNGRSSSPRRASRWSSRSVPSQPGSTERALQ